MKKELDESVSVFSILDERDIDSICKLGRAISSPQRIRILKTLSKKPANLLELSDHLKMPISSVSFNIDILEKAKLIAVDYKPALKGHMKLCSLGKTDIQLILENENSQQNNEVSYEMPVGCYAEANFNDGYLVDDTGFIFRDKDCPHAIYDPKRFNGQLFSFKSGYVVYEFPNLSKNIGEGPIRLSFSMEICSEAPYYCNNWPSDITIWINDVEIATYTSPGDFGGKRGTFTPSFWKTDSTQYGMLKIFSIDSKGTYIDDIYIHNSENINALNLDKCSRIKLKIGFKEDSVHKGGINIFGKKFGNYNQDIVMTISKDMNYDS